MKQKLLLLLMLTFIGSIFSLKAQTTTINFNSAGFSAQHPDDPGSLLPSNVYTTGKFRFTYTIPAQSGIWLRGLSDMGDNNSPSLYLGAISGGTTPLTGSNLETFTIQTIDGSGMNLQSFWFGNLLTTSGISKIEGYRNGGLTGSVSFFPDPSTVNGLISLSPYSYFNNVDKIIIYSGIYGWGDAFDDFVFAPAFSVPALSARALSQTNIACYGSATGLAMVGASGGVAPYSYAWSPVGGTAAMAFGLVAGTYTCVVTDANGASASTSITITQPAAPLKAIASKTDASSYGGSDGSASVLVTGGTAPYTYNWTLNGGIGATATGLSANNYTVFVSDANSCQTSATVTINQPAAPPAIAPDANGIIYVTPTGAGNKSGNSWANAANDLQKSINASGVQQVWVAKGTYKPQYRADNINGSNTNDRNNAFVLKKDVKIYGGFKGDEALLTDRDLTQTANASILSGDLGTSTDSTDNAYHLVISAGDMGTAELNGFTVKDGNANGTGTITVNTKTLRQNSGGGVYNSSSSPILINVTISENTAVSGGAIDNSSSSPILTNVILRGNNAYSGGAIYNEATSSPVITNVIISGNTATNGGAMYNYNSTPALTNVTISGNKATSNGGVMYNYNNPSLNIRNSIIYGNNSGIYNDGTSSTISYSLVQGLTNTDNGNIDGNTDPKFVDAANSDYHLQDGSLLINKGNNAYYSVDSIPDLHLITTDLDGNIRTQKGIVDIGAYESPYGFTLTTDSNHILYVTPTGAGSKSGNSWANAIGDFQAVINASAAGDTVFVAKGTYQPASGSSFSMKEGVKIYGGFDGTETSLSQRDLSAENNSILKGNGNRVMDNSNNNLTAAAVLDGFTITGGNATQGGGMYNNASSPILSNIIFSGNTAKGKDSNNDPLNATAGGSGAGGGIYNTGSSPVLTNVTFNANSANGGNGGLLQNKGGSGTGGGMYNTSSSSPILTNVTFSRNSANGGSAGIGGNSGLGAGGAMYNNSSSPTIRNSIIYGNNSGIANDGTSTPVISYSLVQDSTNTANGNITSTDPKFVNAANGDYHLQSTSPLINKGNNTYFSADSTPDLHLITTDIAGNARIQKGTVDMGAYESQATVLPVILTGFSGKLQNGTANLQWQSGVEAGFSHYELQRSSEISPDGRNGAGVFVTISTIPAKGGNSSYSYKVPQTEAAAYYRLKMVDKDGRADYSTIVVLLQSINGNVLLYPNPARHYINIRVANAGSISIYDASGRSVKAQTVQAGVNTIDVSSFSAGVYYVVVNAQKVKFIKE